MKVTNHTKLWDSKLAWYSLSATHQICLSGLKHSFIIHHFRPTWFCLIIKALALWAKFLEPYLVTVLRSTVPSSFAQQMFLFASAVYMAQFELIKQIPKLDYITHSFVRLSYNTEWSIACVSTPTTTILTTTVRIFLGFELLWFHDICTSNSYVSKYCNT